ncbi:MAG: hypothetical protein ABEH38_04390 [Flavobacteriales bacterium]
MARIKAILLSLFLLPPTWAQAQDLSERDKKYNRKVEYCFRDLASGKKRALKELAGFLSDRTEFTYTSPQGGSRVTTLRRIGLSTLHDITYFKGLELTKELSKKELRDYLDQKGDRIRYYQYLGRFTDIDPRSVSYPHRLRRYEQKGKRSFSELKEKLRKLKEQGDHGAMIPVFWNLGRLRTDKARRFLLECADGKHWGMKECQEVPKLLSAIAFSLGYYRDQEVLDELIRLYEDYDLYGEADWVKAMARVTNNDPTVGIQNDKDRLKTYKILIDSTKNFEKLRKRGYKRFRAEYGLSDDAGPIEMVDHIEHQWWIFDNLKHELLQKEDPKVLHLIARRMVNGIYVYNERSEKKMGSMFDTYQWADMKLDPIPTLQRLSGVVVELKKDGEWKAEGASFKFKLGLMNYWRSHYNDYSYDPEKGRFVNQAEKVLEPDKIKEWFEEMHTENAEKAMKAYIQLTQAPPEKVKQEMKKHSMDYITGDLNDTVPMFTDRFLAQQAELTHYCRENGFRYQPQGEVKEILERMRTSELSFSQKMKLEEELLDKLNRSNVTAVENYGITYGSRNGEFSVMLGHTLDKWYSQHIEQILADTQQVRLYLYKAARFNALGIVGVVNNYLRKLRNISPERLNLFRKLSEEDELAEIREGARKVLNSNLNQDSRKEQIPLSEFLKKEQRYSGKALSKVGLESSDPRAYRSFFDSLRAEEDPKTLKKYVRILYRDQHVNMVPHLIRNLDQNEVLGKGYWGGTDIKGERHNVRFKVRTNDHLAFALGRIYDHFPERPLPSIFDNEFVSSSKRGNFTLWNRHKTKDFWLKKWRKDSADHKEWGKEFFQKQLKELRGKDSLGIESLRNAVTDRYWDHEQHAQYLDGILDRMPCSTLYRIDTGWAVPGYSLDYLRKRCDIPIKYMEKLSKAFFRKEFPTTIRWIMETIENNPDSLRVGKAVNSLCWKDAFRDSLSRPAYKTERARIIRLLRTFAEKTESDFDKEYANKFRTDLEMAGMSFAERVRHLKDKEGDGIDELKEELLEKVPYDSLKKERELLVPMIMEVERMRDPLRSEFGIFFPDDGNDTPKRLKKLLRQKDALTASYRSIAPYLELKKEDGSFRYDRIFELLKFGDVDGLVGSSIPTWDKLHTCVSHYVSEKWKEELLPFSEKEYPDKGYAHQEVLLNFMVEQGWVPSNADAPMSFAHDKAIRIR